MRPPTRSGYSPMVRLETAAFIQSKDWLALAVQGTVPPGTNGRI